MRNKILMNATIILGLLVFAGWVGPQARSQTTGSQSETRVTADQQNQLDQLKQLKDQLQNDRSAVHDAIGKYGFDSDQVDAAREQLVRDRTLYRHLRRSLVAAGVAAPSPSGARLRRPMARQGRLNPRGRGMIRASGRCRCPCAGR
jgi:Spy/CpxP family protein refolding chaperone